MRLEFKMRPNALGPTGEIPAAQNGRSFPRDGAMALPRPAISPAIIETNENCRLALAPPITNTDR